MTGVALDKAYYDRTAVVAKEAGYRTWAQKILDCWQATLPEVVAALPARGNLRTLEIGAGSCTLSLAVSSLPQVAQLHCQDISLRRMQEQSRLSGEFVPGAAPQKLAFHESDMNAALPFADGSIDVVLFDASLHHARSIWNLLAECYRVLAPDGILLAQREQFLSAWRFRKQLRRLVTSEEVKSGVSENSYLIEQYGYFLQAAGFDPTPLPVLPGFLHWLAPLNGRLFSRWNILARKRAVTLPYAPASAHSRSAHRF